MITSDQRALHIAGSVGLDTDAARLQVLHAFVAALVEQALSAGDALTIFFGPEPTSTADPSMPIVFDGTVLRQVAAWSAANPSVQRTLLRAVTAPKHLEHKAPRDNVEVLRELVERGLAVVCSIPDGAFAGETLRKALVDNSNAMVGLSGGKGVRLLAEAAFRERIPFVPLPVDLGSSLSDGRGAADLYAEFMCAPTRFLPSSSPHIGSIESRLSLFSRLAGPVVVAQTVRSLLNTELESADRRNVFALVVTVIPVELRATAKVLDINLEGEPTLTLRGTAFWKGAVEGPSGPRNVALACLGAAGNVTAGVILSDLLGVLAPRLVVVAGIAAGRRGKRKLGDCVVAERVVAYEGAADKDAGIARRPSMSEVPHAVRQFLAAHLAHPAMSQRLTDRFILADGIWPSHPEGGSAPCIHLATIAAGEKLLRRSAFWDELAALHDKIEAAEMEGHGVAVAASISQVPWLVVRGISDFGDQEKSDVFHEAAALAAGCAAADLIARYWESAAISPRTTP